MSASVQVIRTSEPLVLYQVRALDVATWDLALPSAWLYGPDAIAQMILCRLRTHRGEWWLDQRIGVPWLSGEILGQDPSAIATFVPRIRRVIEQTPGVQTVTEIVPVFSDAQQRILEIDFSARVDGGIVVAEAVPSNP